MDFEYNGDFMVAYAHSELEQSMLSGELLSEHSSFSADTHSTDDDSSLSSSHSDLSHDEANAPKKGPAFQVDVEHVLNNKDKYAYENDEDIGECLWDPTALPVNQVDEFLSKVQVRENDLCTSEEALLVLRNNDYNPAKAEDYVKSKGIENSSKKTLSSWSQTEIEAFELGMRYRPKKFGEIKKYEMKDSPKRVADLVNFYFLWKKLPRYQVWLSESQPTEDSSVPPVTPKHIEPHRPETRVKQRVDTLSSSLNSHIWSVSLNDKKRKRYDSDEDPETDNIDGFGDIDPELIRRLKRRRVDHSAESAEENLVDISPEPHTELNISQEMSNATEIPWELSVNLPVPDAMSMSMDVDGYSLRAFSRDIPLEPEVDMFFSVPENLISLPVVQNLNLDIV